MESNTISEIKLENNPEIIRAELVSIDRRCGTCQHWKNGCSLINDKVIIENIKSIVDKFQAEYLPISLKLNIVAVDVSENQGFREVLSINSMAKCPEWRSNV